VAILAAACAPAAPQAATSAPAATTAAKPAASGSGDIVIGTSLPLTGPLAPFGGNLQLGYQRAVDAVNKAGGLDVGGTKRQVTLVVLDNQSDPNMASDQARTLYQRNNAVALLGAATPPLNIPISNVADQMKKPLVLGACPIRAWLSGKADGWQYSWDVFFDENQMTDLQFQTADLVQTNKKIALFTDTEEDGVVMGDLWESKAPKMGYEVAYHAKFPVGTNNFSSQIDAAKGAQAQVLIAQMVPPDAFALWKQMKALGYQPAVAYCEKCGNSGAWHQVLGDVGEGTNAADWWSSSLGYPESQDLVNAYSQQLGGQNTDLSGIVSSYAAAQVLLDAITKAGSTSPEAINSAIGQTDKTYAVGPVKFASDHTSALKAIMDQWQGANMVRVYPTGNGSSPIKSPVPGLSPS
jgi:branched-chain amino acid transport system substrate-binding protein